jgi:hypothetical protein
MKPKFDTTTTKEKVSDVLRCFQRANIYNDKKTEHLPRFVKINKTSERIVFESEISIVADEKADILIKDELKLAPAIINSSFSIVSQCNTREGPVLFSAVFDSNIVNNLIDSASKTSLSKAIAAWYTHKIEGFPATIEMDTAKFRKVNAKESWKVYVPAEPIGTGNKLCYIHFTQWDSWLVLRFISLAPDASAIQIMSESESFIVDLDILQAQATVPGSYLATADYAMFERYLYSHDIEPALDSKSFFNVDDLVDTSDHLIDTFKEDQDDPYIDSDELESEPLKFLNGSEEELERLVTLICHATIPMHHWDALRDFSIIIESAMDEDDVATVSYDSMGWEGWDTVRELLPNKIAYLERALDAALDQNQPYGYSWEYNDGAYHRQSGYDRSACNLRFPMVAPSAHEQICAKIEIKKLASIMGKATIEGLLA